MLDMDSRENGLLERLEASVEKSPDDFWDYRSFEVDELNSLMENHGSSFEKFRKDIEFGKKTVWIKADSGNRNFPNWIREIRSTLLDFSMRTINAEQSSM